MAASPLRFSPLRRVPRALGLGFALAGAFAAAGAQSYDSTAFTAHQWREIGPFRGGRSVAVAGSASRPWEYWFGTTGGGVFKTTDGGTTWTPAADKYFGGTIGAIGVSESNPDIVYVGTGEFPIRGNVSHGDGVFKTTDGGKTWAFAGLGDSRQISRVRVNPKNPDIVYVGAQGHVFGPNAERGVFKTVDGGKTWTKVLYRNDSTGVTDLVMDPTDPEVLYAAFWQAWRRPWQLVSGGAGSGIFKTTDGGAHWAELTRNPGLPSGIIGNIGLAVSPANPKRVWAIVEADSGGVFRSDDAGQTWTRLNGDRRLRQRAWYYTRIFADPIDANTVYVLNTGFYRSSDGGATYRGIPVPHGDNHDLWIAPNDSSRMIESNDGGANVSFNRGRTWSEQDQATAQFYHVITTTHFPYKVCGAQQDNSTLCGPSRAQGGIGIGEWHDAGGGESGYIAARPDDPDITYAGSYGGLLSRKNARTGDERDVNPWPDNPMGHDAADPLYRFQWTFPIVLSPHDPNILYAAANVLFKSTSEGQRWTAISPDLTRHDPKTLGSSGGPITKDQTSVEYYATIFAAAESPLTAGVIWTGSDDGLVHVTRDAGAHWTKVTPPAADLPEWARISIIEPSHYAAGTAYLAANRFQLDDMQPYLFRTTDYGATWKRIDAGITRTEFTRVIREDPVKPGLLYAGTERGVWISFDDGAHWQSLRRNLPIVPVHDLAIAGADLVAATHGRSFWILDDLSPLRQMTPAIAAGGAHLFVPQNPVRASFGGGFGGGGGAHPAGRNPPDGAVIHYWLAQPGQLVTLEFLDARGAVIRHFTSEQDSSVRADSLRADSVWRTRADSLARAGVSADSIKKLQTAFEARASAGAGGGGGGGGEEDGPRRAPPPPRVPNKAGVNRFVWNLQYPDAATFEGLIMWSGGTAGPVAPPGTYAVRLTSGAITETQPFTLLRDPRSRAADVEYQEQFTFAMRIRDRLSEANNAVRTIRNVRWQLGERRAKLPAATQPRLDSLTGTFLTSLGNAESEIYQVKNRSGQDPLNYPIRLNDKLAGVYNHVQSGDARPTAQSYVVFDRLSAQLGTQLAALKAALDGGLPAINAALTAAGQAPVVPGTAEPPRRRGAIAAGGGDTDEDK